MPINVSVYIRKDPDDNSFGKCPPPPFRDPNMFNDVTSTQRPYRFSGEHYWTNFCKATADSDIIRVSPNIMPQPEWNRRALSYANWDMRF